MKTIIQGIIALFILWVAPVFALSVTLQWDANTEPDLAGYYVYESGQRVGTTTATTITLDGYTTARTYTWNVTAYNKSGIESAYSNDVKLSIPQAPIMKALIVGGLEIR